MVHRVAVFFTFADEFVAHLVGLAIFSGRAGIRRSPMTTFNDSPRDSDPQALYGHLIEQLAPLGLACAHVIQGATGGARYPEDAVVPFDYDVLRNQFDGCWMVNNGYGKQDAESLVTGGGADRVAFGRPFSQ